MIAPPFAIASGPATFVAGPAPGGSARDDGSVRDDNAPVLELISAIVLVFSSVSGLLAPAAGSLSVEIGNNGITRTGPENAALARRRPLQVTGATHAATIQRFASTSIDIVTSAGASPSSQLRSRQTPCMIFSKPASESETVW